MGRKPTLQPSHPKQPSLVPSMMGLLELFSRTPRSTKSVPHSTGRETACLWRADAIHRAKNLAQMAVSLAEIADHPTRQWLQPEIAAQVRSLSRAYDALAEDDDGGQVPCDILLGEIATRLTDIFGRPRGVSVRLDVSPTVIAPATRRVLILLCSELIINALKYAYPSSSGGVIDVRLLNDGSHVLLTVADDGVGLGGSTSTGEGSGLIDQLCAVAGAGMTRTTQLNGRGLQVDVTMPMAGFVDEGG